MKDLFCKACNRSLYFQALSNGLCKICEVKINCPHMPCYKVCDECAEKLNLCKQCGKELK